MKLQTTCNEVRRLIIAAKQRGETETAIVLWSGVSVRTVRRIWTLYKTKGSIEPKKSKGRISRMTAEQVDSIREEIRKTPDITLYELIEKLSLPIKKSQLAVLIKKLGYTFKKKRYTQRINSGKMFSRSEKPGKKR